MQLIYRKCSSREDDFGKYSYFQHKEKHHVLILNSGERKSWGFSGAWVITIETDSWLQILTTSVCVYWCITLPPWSKWKPFCWLCHFYLARGDAKAVVDVANYRSRGNATTHKLHTNWCRKRHCLPWFLNIKYFFLYSYVEEMCKSAI